MIRHLCLLVLLCGCVKAPTLPSDATQTDPNAPYPTLVPIGPILAAASVPAPGNPGAGLQAQAAALNARAAALRGPVIDGETAATLQPATPSPALQ